MFYFQSGKDRSQFCIKSRVSLMIFNFFFCLNCFESITANLMHCINFFLSIWIMLLYERYMHRIKYYWSTNSLSYICRYLEIITGINFFCGLIWKSPLTLLYLVSIFYLCLVKNVLKTLISNQEINDSIYWVHTSIYFLGKYIYSRQNPQNAGQFAWAQFT